MALYSFYPCKTDGSSTAIETFHLRTDADAPEVALKVLLDHPRSAYVAVWQGERPVLTRHRLREGKSLDRP